MFHCGEIEYVHADPVSPPGLSLTLRCRATLQNMPAGLGECRDQGEEAASKEQLMVWARHCGAWMLKAVGLKGKGQTRRPRKAAFHLRNVPKRCVTSICFEIYQSIQITKLTDFFGY